MAPFCHSFGAIAKKIKAGGNSNRVVDFKLEIKL